MVAMVLACWHDHYKADLYCQNILMSGVYGLVTQKKEYFVAKTFSMIWGIQIYRILLIFNQNYINVLSLIMLTSIWFPLKQTG